MKSFQEKKSFSWLVENFPNYGFVKDVFFLKNRFSHQKSPITQNFEHFRHYDAYNSKEHEIWSELMLYVITWRFSLYLLKGTLKVDYMKNGDFFYQITTKYDLKEQLKLQTEDNKRKFLIFFSFLEEYFSFSGKKNNVLTLKLVTFSVNWVHETWKI